MTILNIDILIIGSGLFKLAVASMMSVRESNTEKESCDLPKAADLDLFRPNLIIEATGKVILENEAVVMLNNTV